MDLLTGKDLARRLRDACDSVKQRLWIASPYVGGWKSVRRILGRRWWDDTAVEVRLLTDPDEHGLNGATVQRLAQRGIVRRMRGLHAKLYIVDDSILLTSANLTGTAFSKRYEAGTWLTGSCATDAVTLYEDWWDNHSARLASEDLAQLTRNRRREAGEEGGSALTILSSLPSDTGDFGGHRLVKLFRDYPRFLDDYKTLTAKYLAVQRIWPNLPRYFEIDGFLNYLYRDHPERPSKRFAKKPARSLPKATLTHEIRHLARQFKAWADQENADGSWRLTHSMLVRRLLSRRAIRGITRLRIRQVVEGLNCMNDARQRNRFLDNSRNSTGTIRKAWTELLYGTEPLTERMSLCADALFSFKRSSVQELLGFFAPEDYPLRNVTVNAGLRFFGFDVAAH